MFTKIYTLVALTNSVDPGQTASEEEVGSGSSLFAILTTSSDKQHFIREQTEMFSIFHIIYRNRN